MFISHVATGRLKGWGSRALTENDAIEFCRLHRIFIVHDRRQAFGQLRYYKGYSFILINPDLPGSMWIWVLFHEIAHFLLHYPETSKFSKSMKRKNDREANYVAAIALMPKSLLVGRTVDEIVYELGVHPDLVKIREEIFLNQGE